MREFLTHSVINNNLEYLYCSDSVFNNLIKNLKYNKNLEIIESSNNFEDIEEMNYTLMIKKIGDELIQAGNITKKEIDFILEKNGFLLKGVNSVYGVKMYSKRVRVGENRQYVYYFKKSNLILE
jgi:hypothetical protein